MVKDQARNPLGAQVIERDCEIAEFTRRWVNPLGGFWDVASNWSGGVLPTIDDRVLIDVSENVTVTVRSGTNQVGSLV